MRYSCLPLALCAALLACSVPVEEVPSVYDDPATLAQVEAADAAGPLTLRHGAFAFGEYQRYWGFGTTDGRTMSAYRLCRRSGSRCRPLDHPPIAEALPGDPAYRPYAHIFWVPVRSGFPEGERLASFEEVTEAVERGWVEAPERTQTYLHCPIVAPDVRLESGAEPLAPTPIYVGGREALCFDFTPEEPLPLNPELRMLVRNVYVLTREGQSYPLSEGLSAMDLNGDGDLVDGNNVFGTALDRFDYTPLWRMVRVTVPADYVSFDTSGDERTVGYDDSHDMFDIAPDYTITPLPDRIIDYEETEILVDCPIQTADGRI